MSLTAKLSAALLLATAAGVMAMQAEFQPYFHGDTRYQSADGHWTIWSDPPEAEGDGPHIMWLSGPNVPQRRLMAYRGMLDGMWMPDRRHVVLKNSFDSDTMLGVFSLSGRNLVPADALQRSMKTQLAIRPATLKHACFFSLRCPTYRTGPLIAVLKERGVLIGDDLAHLCAIMEEWGWPGVRRTGKVVGRRMIFRLDLDSGRAIPTARCPGAVIPV